MKQKPKFWTGFHPAGQKVLFEFEFPSSNNFLNKHQYERNNKCNKIYCVYIDINGPSFDRKNNSSFRKASIHKSVQ
jgi:hypothetical protein